MHSPAKDGRKTKRKIAIILRRKYSKSFLLAAVVFFVAFLLCSLVLSVFLSQQQQAQRDFTNNVNTHIIDVQYDYSGDLNGLLTFRDNENIRSILDREKISCKLLNIYDLEFSLTDKHGNSFFIYGLGKDAARVFRLPVKEGEGIYVADENAKNNPKLGNMVLQIPKITMTEGGFESKKAEELALPVKKADGDLKTLKMFRGKTDGIYVTEKMYGKILSMIFSEEYSAFQNEYDNGEDFGIQPVRNIFIYCDTLRDVQIAGDALENSRYAVSYTIQAFDNISASVGKNIWQLLGLTMAVHLISILILAISFWSYLQTMQKDIGILRHMDYEPKEIAYIYRINTEKLFRKAILPMLLASGGITFLVAKNIWWIALPVSIALLGVSLVVISCILRAMLRKITNRDVLYLLKFSKEAE